MKEKMEYAVQVTAEIPKEEWAPGLMIGMEGYKPTIVHIDMENRKIVLEFNGYIVDGRNDE